jgi:hypothetical protein
MRQFAPSELMPKGECDVDVKRQEAMGLDFTETFRQVTAVLAYQLWEQRGRPHGTPDIDWQEAERLVSSKLLSLGFLD